jgi:hypothetical protein
MNGYSPGPWVVDIPPIGSDEIRTEDGYLICELPFGALGDPEEANARLLAAAPDLLNACQLIVAYDEDDQADGIKFMQAYADALHAARAAITKATGETP